VSCDDGTLCIDCQRELDQTLREIEDFKVSDLCPDHDQERCHICTVDDYDC
jgi:hypothetical protein